MCSYDVIFEAVFSLGSHQCFTSVGDYIVVAEDFWRCQAKECSRRTIIRSPNSIEENNLIPAKMSIFTGSQSITIHALIFLNTAVRAAPTNQI